MVLLGLTGVYYIISAAMRLRCGRNQLPRKPPRPSPSPPSSSLPSLPCADAQGLESSRLDNARKLLSKFTVADPIVLLSPQQNQNHKLTCKFGIMATDHTLYDHNFAITQELCDHSDNTSNNIFSLNKTRLSK